MNTYLWLNLGISAERVISIVTIAYTLEEAHQAMLRQLRISAAEWGLNPDELEKRYMDVDDLNPAVFPNERGVSFSVVSP